MHLKLGLKTWVYGWALVLTLLLCVVRCQAQVADTLREAAKMDSAARKEPPADTGRIIGPAVTEGEDTVQTDSLKPQPFQPNPKKAGMYSAILPGLGQYYNRQYWKVPVVYGGLGIAAYFIISDLKDYQSYRKAYIGRINNPYPTDQYVNIYTEDQLQQLQNDYSKYLDMSVLFTGIGFALQVVDAITAAHLKNFDVSRDISLQMRPVVFPSGAGLGLVLTFK